MATPAASVVKSAMKFEANGLRRHALQKRDGVGGGYRRPGQIGTIWAAYGGRESKVLFLKRHQTLTRPTENRASAGSGYDALTSLRRPATPGRDRLAGDA